MTSQDIDKLMSTGIFPVPCGNRLMTETHISWLIMCDRRVYKIKKPIQYDFLDFSTPGKRAYFCEREITLNKRLAPEMYLDVVPIWRKANAIGVGPADDAMIIDYAVHMQRMDAARQMDVLLRRARVGLNDIHRLAEVVAGFHKNAARVSDTDVDDIVHQFKAIESLLDRIEDLLGKNYRAHTLSAIEIFTGFMESHSGLLSSRLERGFYRDGHGDLHARNIFLYRDPVIFDCIEFNDAYRRIDVLNDVAFLCMDLDAFGRHDLTSAFVAEYGSLFSCLTSEDDYTLLRFYKCYRANVRAKVNVLRAAGAEGPARDKAIGEARRYFDLMLAYCSNS
jgi:aminoglycoside phosphotransferase family enzyme